MLTINYYFHVLLNTKYKLFINLLIIIVIYSLLYGNKFIYCMNDNPDMTSVPAPAEAKAPHRPSHQVLALRREIVDYASTQTQALFLEKIRVEEKLFAYTHMEPEQLLQRLEEWKQQQQGMRIRQVAGRTLTYEDLSTPFGEKRFLASLQLEGFSQFDRQPALSSKEDIREVYCLLRMFRRLRDIS